MLTIHTPQIRRLRLKEFRPLAVRSLSWGNRASKWWNLDTDQRLSDSIASTIRRASRGTFTKQRRQMNGKPFLESTLLQKYLSTVCFLKFYTHLRASLYKQAPARNAVIMQQGIILLATLPEFWVCEYISWALELPSAPNSNKSA